MNPTIQGIDGSVDNGRVMNGSAFKSLLGDRDRAATLVRRLLSEHAIVHWQLYSVAFVLMAVTAIQGLCRP
jgi:hypothetical protein